MVWPPASSAARWATRVDAHGEPGDHYEAGLGQSRRERGGGIDARPGGAASPHHGDRGGLGKGASGDEEARDRSAGAELGQSRRPLLIPGPDDSRGRETQAHDGIPASRSGVR